MDSGWELGLLLPGGCHDKYCLGSCGIYLEALLAETTSTNITKRRESKERWQICLLQTGMGLAKGNLGCTPCLPTLFIITCSFSVVSFQDPAGLEAHCTYLTSGTALVLCLQRPNAVKKLIDLLGPEDPKIAQALDPFLWRAQYGTSTVQNGFYGRFL